MPQKRLGIGQRFPDCRQKSLPPEPIFQYRAVPKPFEHRADPEWCGKLRGQGNPVLNRLQESRANFEAMLGRTRLIQVFDERQIENLFDSGAVYRGIAQRSGVTVRDASESRACENGPSKARGERHSGLVPAGHGRWRRPVRDDGLRRLPGRVRIP